ncbi:zinc finger, CCHC-type containing protein [Tanacetum coccineum]
MLILKLVDSLDLDVANRERTRPCLFQFSLRDQASNWLERLPAGSISTWEDLTTRESLSEAWTRFKDLLQKVPHHSIDLWLQVQIFYDHVNPVTRRTIDPVAGGLKSKRKPSNPKKISNFVRRVRGLKVFVGDDSDQEKTQYSDSLNLGPAYRQDETFGWLLEEIHVTWAQLEKKRTRLRLYTNYLEEKHTVRGDGIANYKRLRQNTIDLNGDTRNTTRLRLFHFSLHDQAIYWLDRLPVRSISTWDDLTTYFLAQFFLLGRTVELQNDILRFQQRQDESLY